MYLKYVSKFQYKMYIKHETTFFKQYEIDNDENYPSSN